MRTKRHFPVFYTIYFLLLIAFAIGLKIGSDKLDAYISEYNQGLPETVSERFFEGTYKNLDVDKIIQMSGITHGEFETDEDIKDFVRQQFSGELTYTSISSSGDEKKYIVKSGDYKVSTFVLSPDEKGDYFPASLEVHLPKTFERQYTIFSGSTLTVNGITVTDEHILARIDYDNMKYLPEGTPKLEWITYSVGGFTHEPEAKVIDRNGNVAAMEDVDGILCEVLMYDPPEEEIIEHILEGAKIYAVHMQNDASKSEVLPYFEKGTELYDNIKSIETSYVYDHSGYFFENESVTEFMRYDENTVSMRIAFTHVLTQHSQEDYRDDTDITYFARNIDGEYLIYARYNN